MEVQEFLTEFIHWVKKQREILAVVLVGSYARGTAKPDSDIDLVIITNDPKAYLDNGDWMKIFGEIREIKNEDFKFVQARRVFYQNGLEVEYGITTPEWVNTNPVDLGTKKVITAGAKILYDKDGVLKSLFNVLGIK
ncbi:nucleotidyltransferase domain-containing protein [Candidatus Daviesbacteria bacterium]|nr:nucleotidyltransferase domain-containing protein [Candidatus Daviesbacteria bacterium]